MCIGDKANLGTGGVSMVSDMPEQKGHGTASRRVELDSGMVQN